MVLWTLENHTISVLIGKRSTSPARRQWSFPGGTWDPVDGKDAQGKPDYRTTALRETEEETGITFGSTAPLKPIWALHLPRFHFVLFACHVQQYVFPSSLSEFSAMHWAPIHKLPRPLVLFVPSQIRALKRHVKQRKE